MFEAKKPLPEEPFPLSEEVGGATESTTSLPRYADQTEVDVPSEGVDPRETLSKGVCLQLLNRLGRKYIQRRPFAAVRLDFDCNIPTGTGLFTVANSGDWLVCDSEETLSVVTPAQFEALFRPYRAVGPRKPKKASL